MVAMSSKSLDLEQIQDADGVDAALRDLYGRNSAEVPLGTGVLHVTSVWRKDLDTHLTIRIGPHAPPSPLDFFSLNLTRARADAIVTTGRILRQEPELSHRLQGPAAAGLEAWRRERLHKTRPPISLVLTSGRGLDFSHPLFQGPGRVLIYTDTEGAWELESRAADVGAEVVADPSPSPRGAVDVLRRQLGCATISIEAGPSVARQYYEPPVQVDELLLSVYTAPDLPPQARGTRQPPAAELERLLQHQAGPYVDAAEPDWEFHRYLRPL